MQSMWLLLFCPLLPLSACDLTVFRYGFEHLHGIDSVLVNKKKAAIFFSNGRPDASLRTPSPVVEPFDFLTPKTS